MTKLLTLLLFSGLAWGEVETDTSEIDYYQMGIELANEDFSPPLSFLIGCSGLGLVLIPINEMITNVVIPKKHKHILASDGGKEFGKGYRKEYKRLRIKSMSNGLKGWCMVAGILAFQVIDHLW